MGDQVSIPRGRRVVPLGVGIEVSSDSRFDSKGLGKRKVRAIPASVAKPMNGIVKMSIPRDIWRRI